MLVWLFGGVVALVVLWVVAYFNIHFDFEDEDKKTKS